MCRLGVLEFISLDYDAINLHRYSLHANRCIFDIFTAANAWLAGWFPGSLAPLQIRINDRCCFLSLSLKYPIYFARHKNRRKLKSSRSRRSLSFSLSQKHWVSFSMIRQARRFIRKKLFLAQHLSKMIQFDASKTNEGEVGGGD